MKETAMPIPAGAAKRLLLGLSEAELQGVAAELGLPAYVGRQLAHWMYVRGAAGFGAMTNLSREARSLLEERCALGRSVPLRRQASLRHG